MATGLEKILGCLAASQVGSAMGAAVEGWSWQKIRDTHGRLEELLPYQHYGNGWDRPPGTTEDGIERQRVLLRAIRRVGGRPTADDVGAVWREEVDADKADWCMEPFDRRLIRLAQARLSGPELGQFNPFTNLVSLARSCHPLGLVSAGDPPGAVANVQDVGRAFQRPQGDGLAWAGVVAGGIAAAMEREATVESVLEAARAAAPGRLHKEMDRGLAVAEGAEGLDDAIAMREAFDAIYSGRGTPYAFSYAGEVVSKALAVVRAARGRPREAIVAAVNFGRDTDCLAAVAGGLAGAIAGHKPIPPAWLGQVDAATEVNPYTNLKLTLEAQAHIVWEALESEHERARARQTTLARVLEGQGDTHGPL